MIYSNTHNIFTGPLFIVGMPRSGTKLLRDLLNQHPKIGIPTVETNILALWRNNWQHYGDLSNRSTFNKFYHKMLQKSYFMYMKENNNLIGCDIWYNLCMEYTPAGVFEALIRHDAEVGYKTSKIWGDKSPSYIRHTPLLKKNFPQARIIHIIRDVRDYCLSINNAWGKNIIRAAQRWSDDVRKINSDSRLFQKDYIEIKYEDLISQPHSILQKICDFIHIEFDSKILKLSEPSENIGDAKGMKGIKTDNTKKYLFLMNPITLEKVEAIAASVLRSHGYSVNYSGKTKNVNKFKMIYYQSIDAINMIKFDMRQKGFQYAVKRNIRLFH